MNKLEQIKISVLAHTTRFFLRIAIVIIDLICKIKYRKGEEKKQGEVLNE